MVVMSKMERWQHEPWGAIGDCAKPRRADLVSVRELEQWRSTPVGRAGAD